MTKEQIAALEDRPQTRRDMDRLLEERQRLLKALQEKVACYNHADACCLDWCSMCQAEAEWSVKRKSALAFAEEEAP